MASRLCHLASHCKVSMSISVFYIGLMMMHSLSPPSGSSVFSHFRIRSAVHSKWTISRFQIPFQYTLSQRQCATSTDSISDRERFELKLADLMNSEFAEQEWTESTFPSSILDELTSSLSAPVLPRISRKELHHFLKLHPDALMPFAEVLQHWMVMNDEEMEQHLDSIHKQQDVNYVVIPTEEKEEEIESGTVSALYDDHDLMEKIKKTEYLNGFKADDLYSAAMQFYDISSPATDPTKDAANRLSTILLILASIVGHKEAHLHLGKQYLLGYGVDRNYESAIYHFVRSAAMGSVDSRTFLGIMYLRGYGVKRNVERAFVLLTESSRWMNPIAQRFLAELYEKGHRDEDGDGFEIERDYHIALCLAERAVSGGSTKLASNRALFDGDFVAEAATICGRMYCLERNDFVNGLRFLEMAASDGNADALCNVGHLYHIGVRGQIEVDLIKAISFLLKAANDGHKRAHRELGMIYLYNLDDAQIGNAEDGVMWMDLAAKEGFIDCYFRIGEIYAVGNQKYEGIAQNIKAAKKYLEMARDESNLSTNHRHKLPENVWNLILNNPLQASSLIDNYEKAIGAKWRGQFLGDLNPENYQNKMR